MKDFLNPEHTVTFETKCYEKDWKYIVGTGFLERTIDNCNFEFDKKILFLNNFSNYSPVKKKADLLVSRNVIDEYYVVNNYAIKALEFFDLEKDDFKGGYYYSIAELVSIYLCNTDFNLHFSGDSTMQENCAASWIKDAIDMMSVQQDILVANPTWNSDYDEAKSESFDEDDSWYYSYGFSDQCYLIKTQDFKKQIFKYQHHASERYPKYGGELFEKRVDAYMRNVELKRITSKHCSYIHQNFPKPKINPFIKFLKKMS